jgi:hypothetical protein
LRDQLTKSENRGKALEAHLEECKDKIFSTQPQQIVPDTTIMAMHNSLCLNIDTWGERQFANQDGDFMGLSQRVWGEKL